MRLLSPAQTRTPFFENHVMQFRVLRHTTTDTPRAGLEEIPAQVPVQKRRKGSDPVKPDDNFVAGGCRSI